MRNRKVPFYANTPDDTHCFQAALRMVLKYFIPDKEYSWEELDKMTAKVEELWTWPTQGILNLQKMGFEIIDMDSFDIKAFVEKSGDYLKEKFGEEVSSEQIKHSDIPQEKKIYSQYLELGIHQTKLPTLEDIKSAIDNGYLAICNINSRVLNDVSGYVGHFVVIYDYDQENFYLNDPGLPGIEAKQISYDQFLKAWEYPSTDACNLLAFKKS